MPHCRYFQLRAAAAPAATLEHKLDGPQREIEGPGGVLSVSAMPRRLRRGLRTALIHRRQTNLALSRARVHKQTQMPSGTLVLTAGNTHAVQEAVQY